MFRRFDSKIIVSFCLLMLAGGVVTTTVLSRNLSRELVGAVERSGTALSRALATGLAEPLSHHDHVAVRRDLVQAQSGNPDIAYVFVASDEGQVSDHSFAIDGFPADLLPLAERSTPTTLRVEDGLVRDLPQPIAEGALGTVHVGVSLRWASATTSASVTNVLLVTGLAMLVGIVGILLLARLITRPMLGLVGAAKRLGRGDYGTPARVAGRDEVASLANTFNTLASQIRARMAESEELRSYVERILDHMDAEVCVISEDGVIDYANRMAIERRGVAAGEKCATALGSERPCATCSVAEVLETGRVLNRSHVSPSGRHYELTYFPMTGRDGRRAVVESALDVTEQRKLALRVHRAERLAVAGSVAAGVVHTINNPLDGVTRALGLAESRLTDNPEQARKMLALAREGTERIAAVTHRLLVLARAEEPSEHTPVTLDAIVAQATEVVQLKAQATGARVELALAPELPAVSVDPHGITEVLVNLLMNAIDACGKGGTITVATRLADAATVELSASDDGPGIAPEHLDRVFEPFFTTKEVGRGTGLGLSVARRIVEAHGGEIEVTSTPGSGATFRVRLPIATPPLASAGRADA
ncbi:MAG: HAMP domain-containing protein [Polyangiaceae bacterium]|nr:HAMP domain-containing protein [Polyangiaceae bacterium]